MRRSEKALLAILVLGLLTWQGSRLANRLLFDPIWRSQAELDRLDEEIADQKIRAAELASAESGLKLWQQRSLPPDPLTAQRLYQQWLTDLGQECGFDKMKVYPDRVIPKDDSCVGVLVSINADARLDQLCLFLSRFYRTKLAQQITALNISSNENRGDPILRITIVAEGLSLRDAVPRQQLFSSNTSTSAPPVDAPSVDYEQLVANNPFAKPTPRIVERPRPVVEETPAIDPAEFTYLVAAFAQNDQRQAWLYDRLNDENVVIAPGKPFSVAGIDGVVQTIGDDFILLDYNESRWRLRLGKSLRAMELVQVDDNATAPRTGQE